MYTFKYVYMEQKQISIYFTNKMTQKYVLWFFNLQTQETPTKIDSKNIVSKNIIFFIGLHFIVKRWNRIIYRDKFAIYKSTRYIKYFMNKLERLFLCHAMFIRF